MAADRPCRFSPQALEQYFRICDESTSSQILQGFYTTKPSFFTLARSLMGTLSLPAITQRESFFLSQPFPSGVLLTPDELDESISARVVWAAVSLIQARLGDLLLSYFHLRGQTPIESSVPKLTATFAYLESYLVNSFS
jgi:hypothetical protein